MMPQVSQYDANMTPDVIISRHPVTGAWLVSDIIGGQLIKQQYYGYTKREALTAFRAYCRNLEA